MTQATVTPTTTDPELTDSPARYLPIAFAGLAVVGLGLWFSGGGDGGEPTHGALVGAGVICAAMLCLIGFCAWLARSPRPLVRAGAAAMALAGLCHLVENLLVLGPGRDGDASASGTWDVINTLSPTAFTLLGVGALLVGIGLPVPAWLRAWGVLTGVLGLLAGLSALVPVLEFIPGPMNVSALGFLITVGLRRGR